MSRSRKGGVLVINYRDARFLQAILKARDDGAGKHLGLCSHSGGRSRGLA